ncbi:MAG: tRNA pseudouridine(13) synthase TruD [Thermoplasmatales archaeon]|nr:tRNA pseudouridine(13) synthase TruD [Thermoplasmatales archaeon]MCW6169784.1 tRNA pseudouridine(13) synthase TruD [Thermoplasmatales archaeon]
MTKDNEPKERAVGISGFSSSPNEKVGGSIKLDPEDFIVEEVPDNMNEDPNGKYTALKIQLKNWDTNRFISFLARRLQISKKRITYAGTKDKRAITTQYFTVNGTIDQSSVELRDCNVLEIFKCNRMLKLGDLRGNTFTINIHYDENDREKILRIYDEVLQNGGFPNFFGLQRFGEIRTNTHKIGRLILEGDIERAVRTYIYDREIDTEDYRVQFGETNDPCLALNSFPKHLSFERSLLGYLCAHGEIRDAFSVLPRNLAIMFVHAYQSYIFNNVLSERLLKFGRLDKVVSGDIMYKIDELFNSAKDSEIKENGYNMDKLQQLSITDKIRPTIIVPGYESVIPKGDEGEIEARVLENERIELEQFKILNHPELSSKGERRIISAKPVNFIINNDGSFKFTLGRGIYATSFLREFIKF